MRANFTFICGFCLCQGISLLIQGKTYLSKVKYVLYIYIDEEAHKGN